MHILFGNKRAIIFYYPRDELCHLHLGEQLNALIQSQNRSRGLVYVLCARAGETDVVGAAQLARFGRNYAIRML